MRINKLQNSPTFGYDKLLSKQLEKRLAKEPDNDFFIATIKDLNTFCNNTEDMLSIYTENDSPKGDMLYSALISAKIPLADMVEKKYPDLKYIQKEIDAYQQEGAKSVEKNNEEWPWQFDMAFELTDLMELSDNYPPPEEADDPNETGEKTPATDKPQPEKTEAPQTNNVKPPAKTKEDDELKPSELVERFVPNEFSPKGFKSLGGLEALKEELYDKIIEPALNPAQAQLDFEEYGKRAPRGFMFFGPPGCGKTSIVEALSQEAGLPLFKLKISKAGSKFINETSNNYQRAFDYVAECARLLDSPCLMLIDEIDGFTKGRGDSDSSSEDLKQVGTLLNLIEGARERNIIVIGTTNKYDMIDEAVRRRFDHQVYLGLPDSETREIILHKTLSQWIKGRPLARHKDHLREIVEKTAGFPSSALLILADKASTSARKDGRRIIMKEDFFDAIEKNQNLKVKEDNYQAKVNRRTIGFGKN